MAWKVYNLQGCLRGTCVWALGQPKQQLGCGVSRCRGALWWEAQPAAGKMLQGRQAIEGCGRARGSTGFLTFPIGKEQLISHSSSHSKAFAMLKSHISHMMPSILSHSIKAS